MDPNLDATDRNGNPLKGGDSVRIIKDLKRKATSVTFK